MRCPQCHSEAPAQADFRAIPALQPRRTAFYCRSPRCGYQWPEKARAGGFTPRDLMLWGLRFYCGNSDEEVAEITGVPMWAIHRILAGMQRRGSPDEDLALDAVAAFTRYTPEQAAAWSRELGYEVNKERLDMMRESYRGRSRAQ